MSSGAGSSGFGRKPAFLILAALALLGGALGYAQTRHASARDGPVGLFTTLPILWNEAPDVAGLIKDRDPPHWARGLIAARGRITALDTLAAPGGAGPLRQVRRLVMAQPRPLSPDENVALDDWVRGGGRVLLFADPALTEESAFSIGDPRRPQSVVLLSPILRRWGLDLRFDEGQPFGERQVRLGTGAVPVNLPGHFALLPGANCTLSDQQLVAVCRVGRGRAAVVADAEVLARDDPDGTRAQALSTLLETAFSTP
ncbi:MAG: ABC transporter [Proteobacteria bacterium]|nr:ABC transporter [Pseudomonadota bacterium]